jgi:hypothetical protein
MSWQLLVCSGSIATNKWLNAMSNKWNTLAIHHPNQRNCLACSVVCKVSGAFVFWNAVSMVRFNALYTLLPAVRV